MCRSAEGGIPYLGILIYAQVRTGLRCAYKGERSLAQTALRRYTHMVNVHDGIRARRLVGPSTPKQSARSCGRSLPNGWAFRVTW